MADIKLLSQPCCNMCAQVKRILPNYGYEQGKDYDIVDCTTDEGSRMADHFKVRNLPALVVNYHDVYRNYGDILTWIKAHKKQ